MEIFQTIEQIRSWSRSQKHRLGLRIAFVPTMGYLHDGHLSLIREARRLADRVVVSLFVNPTQFNNPEDLEKYPRNEAGDIRKCLAAGCDALFIPSVEEMFPHKPLTKVSVPEFSETLCGAFRPGHFDGVATVVAKLFNIVEPEVAVFGQKDYQQLAVIRQMVRDLNMPIQIEGRPTIRESDGLAMSSRNARLSPTGRIQARCLYHALSKAKQMISEGVSDPEILKSEARNVIRREGDFSIDYIDLIHPDTLAPLETVGPGAVMAMALHIEGVRLIDNMTMD